MNEVTNQSWPVANQDPLQRLRALTASLPGAAVAEQIIPAPLDDVWAVAGDIERAAPRSEWHVRSLRIVRRDGERIEALVTGLAGVQDRFFGVLRPGWCWMQGRVLYIGMAAVADPGGTRFVLAAGLRLPGAQIVRPIIKWSITRSLRRIAERVETMPPASREHVVTK